MTYFKAIEIKQDLIVNMQYAFNKTPAEALKETAAKYTAEQFAEALLAIKQQMRKEYDDVKELFMIAAASKNIDMGGKKKNG